MRSAQYPVEDQHIFGELVGQVYAQTPVLVFGSLVVATLVNVALWPMEPWAGVHVWAASLCAVYLLRYALYRAYLRRDRSRFSERYWLRLYSAGALTGGAVWGAAPLLFFSSNHPQVNVFLAFVIGGVVSGTAGAMAVLTGTMWLFTAMLCVPIAILFLRQGNCLNTVMGITILIYGVAYSVIARNTGHMIKDAMGLRDSRSREVNARKQAEAELQATLEGLEATVDRRAGEIRRTNDKLSREIAERRQVEARLKESELRYRSLVESSSDLIWEADTGGRYTYVSPSVFDLLGYKPEELSGRTLFDLMPPDESERVNEVFTTRCARGESFRGVTNRRLHKDGTERIFETNGEPIRDGDGEVIGCRGIDRDITLRVKHDEELRKIEHLKSLGTLAGGIAHDFNNLLTGIFGNVDMARTMVSEGGEVEKTLTDAMGAMEQARRLTGHLLTFSKGGSPMLEAAPIGRIIRDACGLALSGSSVKCILNVPDSLWMTEVDRGQIWQVFSSVLANARDAMPGGGTLWVTGVNEHVGDVSPLPLAPGDYVKLSFQDDGVGVATHNLAHVFDPYFSTKPRGTTRGVGIGLAVCLSVVERHGGHITMDSVEGEGTTVTIYLRATRDGGLTRTPALEQAARGAPSGRMQRILMLEDDEDVLRSSVKLLERMGHTVMAVRHGEAVVELYTNAQLEGSQFDLVILDLTVRGGMGGVDTVQALIAVDPDVKAVVTSGYADDEVMSRYSAYGFSGALAKPYTYDMLRDLIDRL